MTEFHIEIPGMAWIGTWKSQNSNNFSLVQRFSLVWRHNHKKWSFIYGVQVKCTFWLHLFNKHQNHYHHRLNSPLHKTRDNEAMAVCCLSNGAEDLYWAASSNTHTVRPNGLWSRSKCSKWDAFCTKRPMHHSIPQQDHQRWRYITLEHLTIEGLNKVIDWIDQMGKMFVCTFTTLETLNTPLKVIKMNRYHFPLL